MNRDHAIGRLRVWVAHAQQEAEYANTLEDTLNWQGQAQVLSSAATYLSVPGAQADDSIIWKQVVADREGAIAAWEKQQEGPQAMYAAGMVAGYDVALTILADVMGKVYTENPLAYG